MPDRYTVIARIGPALLVFAPLIVLAVALGLGTTPSALGGAAVLAAGSFAAGETVRRAGQRLEPRLWSSWGGSPTLRALRWSTARAPDELARRHADVHTATGVRLPDSDREQADPAAADRTYDDAVARLRDLTRKTDEFPLVHAENIAYGFARNMLAVKPAAITTSLVALAGSGAIYLLRNGTIEERLAAIAAPGLFSTVLLGWLVLVVSAGWVRPVAERYADRLLGAAAKLARPDPGAPA